VAMAQWFQKADYRLVSSSPVRYTSAMPASSFRGMGMARACAYIAAALGLAYAAVSAYWALGGTALLSTVGGSVERDARQAGVLITVGLWAVVLVKLVAAALPARALAAPPGRGWATVLWRLTQAEAAVLTVYGLVLTSTGLLVQSGVVHADAGADRRALAWHTYLWDPWFLVWGLAVAGVLICGPGLPARARERA
jgi:hypothetical protein